MKIQLNGETVKEYTPGVRLLDIARETAGESPAMAAYVDGREKELADTIRRDCSVCFVTLQEPEGFRIYLRTLIYVFIHAAQRALGPDARVRIKHSLSGNLYAEISRRTSQGGSTRTLSPAEIEAIEEQMRAVIAANLPIRKKNFPLDEAQEYFESEGIRDKQRLFAYRSTSGVNLYQLEDELDYFYGFMLPETGCLLPEQSLLPYGEGVILRTPSRQVPHALRPFKPMEKLFDIFQQSKEWSQILGVEDVGALNDCIADGRIGELIQTSEALHAKRLAEIAGEIAARPAVKLVLIAGPSSSGKTTFAQRLMIQLRAEGRTPHLISMDNYFVNREQTPLDEDGQPNYECLGAVDVERFNADMASLMAWEPAEIPLYNFKKGQREASGRSLQLKERDILIVEGIHCLNEEVSRQVARENKYKIYISALTLINIDDHNRIPTTDGRLLRRMIRDNAHRGASAAHTIAMWPSVRRGEEENIFPYQEEADTMFNSAHIYELAVLKQYAEPLLYRIQRSEPEYDEARRLIKFLDYFLSVSSEEVPDTSLIREFIGGGIFEQ